MVEETKEKIRTFAVKHTLQHGAVNKKTDWLQRYHLENGHTSCILLAHKKLQQVLLKCFMIILSPRQHKAFLIAVVEFT